MQDCLWFLFNAHLVTFTTQIKTYIQHSLFYSFYKNKMSKFVAMVQSVAPGSCSGSEVSRLEPRVNGMSMSLRSPHSPHLAMVTDWLLKIEKKNKFTYNE